mmetsp:Transcript_106319/g.184800  ORF Transcript_106319/g.184800 Transcript_106319/m.184800 type:complete len:204 (-) Transcript_106319:169-780(-)
MIMTSMVGVSSKRGAILPSMSGTCTRSIRRMSMSFMFGYFMVTVSAVVSVARSAFRRRTSRSSLIIRFKVSSFISNSSRCWEVMLSRASFLLRSASASAAFRASSSFLLRMSSASSLAFSSSAALLLKPGTVPSVSTHISCIFSPFFRAAGPGSRMPLSFTVLSSSRFRPSITRLNVSGGISIFATRASFRAPTGVFLPTLAT